MSTIARVNITDQVPVAEVQSCLWEDRRIKSWVEGAIQLTRAVKASQFWVATGRLIDTHVPVLQAVFKGAGGESFLHLLITVGAVAVAVVSAGALEVQPRQSLFHGGFRSRPRRRCCPAQAQTGFCNGYRHLPGWWFGCLRRNMLFFISII